MRTLHAGRAHQGGSRPARRGRWWAAAPTFAALAFLARPMLADAPQPPPADYEAHSPDGRCVARAELGRNRVVVSSRHAGAAWIVPGWHRHLLVANDCRVLGVGYAGGSLLRDADHAPGTPVMRFLHADGPERVVRLHDLYPDLAAMPATASHRLLYWTSRWDGLRWTVGTADGRTLYFTP